MELSSMFPLHHPCRIQEDEERRASPAMELLLPVLAVFLASSASAILNRRKGESCESHNGNRGTCSLLSTCEYPGDFKKDRPPICTFEKKEPVICCPLSVSEKTRFTGLKIKEYCEFEETNCLKNKEGEDPEDDSCNITRHVIGGTEAKPKTYIHMALIGYGPAGEKEWGCGGSLINHRFVLSAAHCANPAFLGVARWARFGDLDTSTNTDDAMIQEREIVERVIHPEYKETEVYNDIALFKLDKDVEFTPWVGPACLYTEKSILATSAIVTGWGRVDFSGATSDKLLEAELDIFKDEDCTKLLPVKNEKSPKGIDSRLMFCAGKIDGTRDSCSGDSGGPLVLTNVSSTKCLKSQIGITSYGYQCGLPNSPGVYTRVSAYIAWIEDIAFSKDSNDGLIFG